jgi:LemA protein
MVLSFGLIIGIVLVALIVLFFLMLIVYYNRFTILENRIENSESQIDVQLRKRAELVPNLVSSVKGYAKHEKDILDGVSKARASMMKGDSLPDRLKAGDQLQGFLGRLFAIAENYPQLRANENFLQLQTELSAIEDKIAYARQYYNDSVLSYDNATSLIPGVIFFKILGKPKKDYLKIPEAHKQAPKVEF